MTPPTKEALMAYADGALTPDRCIEIEAHLAVSPVDRALVEQFRSSKRLAKRAVSDLGLTPRPELIALLQADKKGEADDGLSPDDAATVIPLLKSRRIPNALSRYALPLAAGIALAIGFGGGYFASIGRSPDASLAIGSISSGSPLAVVLDTEISGSPSKRYPGLQIVATFYDQANRPCREVEQLASGGAKQPVAAAIACRAPQGWVVEGATRVVPAASQGEIRPSGASDRDPLSSILDRLGAKPSLSRSDEQRLIEQSWR